ncbi:MarR family transcriptional regulator [Streptomyces sp. NPDC021622]|uniref:MarR family transcriptional regulator n=1 Tax=Streptomyces sp. NPDC021622 TaxID=3155013 RepID=UPI00340ECCA6
MFPYGARERPELDTSPLEVLARLHRTFLPYNTRLTTAIERHGLAVAGFDVLTALRRAGAPYRLTAGQLADSGLVSSAGVTLRIDRLEKDGLARLMSKLERSITDSDGPHEAEA